MTAARSAVVVGAGVGGLAVAGALARTGWRVTLLERAERLRAEPTALLLWPAGVRALQALGVGHGLDAVSTPAPDQGVRRPDGQWLVPPDAAGRVWSRHAAGRSAPELREQAEGGGRAEVTPQATQPARHPLLVHAEDLHDALVAGLTEQVEIHPGVAVRRMAVTDPASTDLPAVTDGRATWTADLVVAADGVDSVLRQRVTRRSGVVSAGATAWRALIPWHRAPRLPDELAAGGHTHGGSYQFFSAPLGQRGATGGSSRGGCYWRATVVGAPRPEPPAAQLNLLRRWFDGWHEPVGELLAATEPRDLVQRELRVVRPAPSRYAVEIGPGALVLLGDAGHAMAEHLGQGACLALEDAATLVAMVREADPGPSLQAALGAYEAARRPRLAEVLRRSSRLGATGAFARRGSVLARRRDKAATAATTWQPPAAG